MQPVAGLASPLVHRGDHYSFSFAADGPEDATTFLFDELLRVEEAHPEAMPLRILIDIRAPRQSRPGSTRTALRRHREFDGRRVAVLGAAGAGPLVDVLIRATGHRTTRYFTDEAAALAWLREG